MSNKSLNVNWKADSGQLNVAHVVRKKKKKLKQTNASANWVQSKSRIREGNQNGTRD